MKTLRQVVLIAVSVVVGLALVPMTAAKSVEAQQKDTPLPGLYMGVGNQNPAGGEIKQANNPNPVFQFSIWQVGGSDKKCTSIKSMNNGTAVPADISAFRLWVDVNNDGKFTAGTDELLGSSASGEFNGLNLIIKRDAGVNLLITADVSTNAVVGKTVQLSIKKTDIVFQGGAAISAPDEINGNTFSIYVAPATLSLGSGTQVPAADVYVGTIAAPVLQFSLTAGSTGAPAHVTSMKVEGAPSQGHTATPIDVTSVRLYREGGTPNGVVDGSDVHVGDGVFDGGQFSYVFNGFTETISAGTSRTYLVVVDVASNAHAGHVFVVALRQSSIFTNATWPHTSESVVTGAPQTIIEAISAGLKVENPDLPDMVAGNFITPITVSAILEDGTVDTSFVGQVAVSFETSPPGAAFTQTSTVVVFAVDGVAVFSELMLQQAGVYRLKFLSSLLPDVETALTDFFEVLPGNAVKLVIAVQPSGGKVGAALDPAPVVNAFDQFNNLATGFNGQVTATLVVGTGVFTGSPVAAVNGVATFNNLVFLTTGNNLRFVFSSAGLASSPWSDAFIITVGDPVGLTIHHPPISTLSGQVFSPAPQVFVVDAGGNVVLGYSEPIHAAIGNNPSGGTLSGTTTKAPTGGQVVFSDLSINKPGNSYTLVFTSGSLSATTLGFDIVLGPPVKLAVIQQPSSGTGGIAFATQPVVQVQDAGGNHVTTDNSSIVQVQITSGTGEPGATLSGVVSLTVSGGQAAFDGLSINKASATPYTLRFVATTVPNYTPATSEPFTITVGPAARVGLATQPGLATMGHPFVQQPVAQIQDMGGNHVVGASGTITVRKDTSVSPPGTTLQGTTALVTTGGQAAFTDLAFDLPGLGFVLIFESGALLAAHSSPFNVASTATHLAVVVEPGPGSVEIPLVIQPVVEIRDAAGVLVSVDNFSLVTAEIVPGTGAPGALLEGQTSVYAVNGVASFFNLKVTAPGQGYHLRFTSVPVLTHVNSAAFNVSGLAVKMLLTQQPAGANAGEVLSVQPKLVILDNNNIPVFTDNSTVVTAYIQPSTGGAHAILGGTVTVTAFNGVVQFTDLTIDRPGTGYRLVFSAMPVLQQAASASFSIAGDTPPQAGTRSGIPGSAGGGCSTGHESAPWLLLGLLVIFAVARHVSFPRKDLSR